MDAYLLSTKPATAASTRATSVKPGEGKPCPFASLTDASKPSTASTSRNRIQGGVRAANNAIIKTLGKEDNPITNSTAYQRTLHVSATLRDQYLTHFSTAQSCSSGHQSGGGPGRKWALHRNTKLRLQAADAESQALKGVVAYMSGYTGGDITNTQLKALVEMQGGRMVTVATARCTHIFITSNLSGSKAQKYLEAYRKNGAKLVTPQWAIECARRGRRVSEAQFAAPVYHEGQESAYAIYSSARGSVPPSDASTSSSVSPPADAPAASTSFFPPAPPRTRSQTDSSPRFTPAAVLPAAQISRPSSPRKRAAPAPAPITLAPKKAAASTSSATALLLAQLAAQAARRSPGRTSPGREKRTGTKRRSTHVATWECAGDVRSPPRVKGRAAVAATVAAVVVGEGGRGKKRRVEEEGKGKGREESDVLVLSSSDAEVEVGILRAEQASGRRRGEAEVEVGESSDEVGEWGMPPSGQGH